MISLKGVSAGYSSQAVIHDISLSFELGQTVAVVGKNGCGKTTLLKVCSRMLKPLSGSVTLCGKDLSEYSPKEIARKISVLPQVRNVPDITAYALVMHGRFPYMGFLRVASKADKAAVERAMEITDTARFRDVSVKLLSGGERQRVYLAMLLAQDTDIVLLDEPSAYLDLKTQFDLLDMVSSLKEQGKIAVAVMHDLTAAMTSFDRIIMMQEGSIAYDGGAEELYESGLIEKCMEIMPHRAESDGKTFYYFTPHEAE